MSCGDITIDSSLDGAECVFENLEPKKNSRLLLQLRIAYGLPWWVE